MVTGVYVSLRESLGDSRGRHIHLRLFTYGIFVWQASNNLFCHYRTVTRPCWLYSKVRCIVVRKQLARRRSVCLTGQATTSVLIAHKTQQRFFSAVNRSMSRSWVAVPSL